MRTRTPRTIILLGASLLVLLRGPSSRSAFSLWVLVHQTILPFPQAERPPRELPQYLQMRFIMAILARPTECTWPSRLPPSVSHFSCILSLKGREEPVGVPLSCPLDARRSRIFGPESEP